MKSRLTASAILLFAAFLFAHPAAAKPKLTSIQALAQSLAAKLPQRPGYVIYVPLPDWKPIGKVKHYALREKIATDLVAALAAADPSAETLGPARTGAALSQLGFQDLDIYLMTGDQVAAHIAKAAGDAAAVVTCNITESDGALALTVAAVGTKQARTLAKLTATLPESPQLQALLATRAKPIEDSAGVYLAGVGGVGRPQCLRCRYPRFTRNAIRTKSSGPVTLGATVGVNGRPSQITVLSKPLGNGLDQSAVRTLRSWRLTPATGPTGKPVPTRIEVMVSFRMI